ncbi:MAG: UDP-N-acetylglucosamine--N-acetylmuramyl-(pentapeptide) pyrophosphoryl-undecaprenol N-acetylglucosamine transferase [bacterium]|nr:UDP-N-acetylglucosamine--N-acetylmuramyl-(pentapeptide) pyrophosphoryl-undecaprenol N-acetylglucosamine transferase [bacterium]
MSGKRNLLICAGGTGGHIIPAITIGLSLERFNAVFVCGSRSIEKTIYEEYKIKPISLDLGSFSVVGYALKFPKNLLMSLLLIKRINPSSVLVAGNYTSGPVGLAAILLNKKLLAIEQDSLIGKANRIFAKFAYRIFTAYPPPFRHIDNRKGVFTGHVIRDGIRFPKKNLDDIEIESNRKKVLIIGGSQGAYSMTKALVSILSDDDKYHLIVVAGKSSDRFENKSNVTVLPYYKNMGYLYSLADIIIARSGALSVAEIAYSNKPALFVPLPSASNDEQTKNVATLMKTNIQFDFIPESRITKEAVIRKLERIENLRGVNSQSNDRFIQQIKIIEKYV